MHDIALLLGAAAGGWLVIRATGAPPIPVLLLAGWVVARVAHLSEGMVGDAVVLGASFLLFTAGMELSARRVRSEAPTAFRVGIVQFAVLGILGWAAAFALGYRGLEAGYLALALTASSTLVGVRLLKRSRRMFEPFGRLVLGVLLVQDFLVLLAVPLVLGMASGVRTALTGLAGTAVLGGLTWVARRWIGPLLVRVQDEPELVLLGALSLLFAFLAVSAQAGIPLVLGAFLAGVALSSFPVDGMVRAVTTPIGDFFAAILFTALGALVVAPRPEHLVEVAVLAVVVIGVTVPLVTVLAIRRGFSLRPAVETGLLLSQTSEISLALGLTGMLQGHIGAGAFTVIALVTVSTMLLTPLLATEAVVGLIARRFPQRRPATDVPPRDHVLVLGAGSTGSMLLEDLLLSGCALTVVDEDPRLAGRLREAGIRVVRGSASDPAVLEAAGASRARLVISTLQRARDAGRLLELTPDVPVLVRVFEAPEAEWVRARGGEAVLFYDAAAGQFLEWVDEEGDDLRERLAARLAGGIPTGLHHPGGP